MKKIIYPLTVLTLIGCSSPPVIDNTPVESLQPGGSMKLIQQEGADFSDPDSAAWRNAQEYAVELTLAPPVHASVNLRYDNAAPAVPVNVRVASDGSQYFVRLRWQDGSADTTTSRSQFSDGAAVQFALKYVANTSYMMGAAATPVNIWYWKAGQDQAQNLAAGGFGSTTQLPTGELAVASRYREKGEWVVVFSRPLQHSGEHQVTLDNDSVSVALAVWQGTSQQRDGLKHVSQGWVTVDSGSSDVE